MSMDSDLDWQKTDMKIWILMFLLRSNFCAIFNAFQTLWDLGLDLDTI